MSKFCRLQRSEVLDWLVTLTNREFNETIYITGTLVFKLLGVKALIRGEIQQGRVALHVELRAESFVGFLSAIDLADVDYSRLLISKLVPGRGELLAVTAPGSIELNEPAVTVDGFLAIPD